MLVSGLSQRRSRACKPEIITAHIPFGVLVLFRRTPRLSSSFGCTDRRNGPLLPIIYLAVSASSAGNGPFLMRSGRNWLDAVGNHVWCPVFACSWHNHLNPDIKKTPWTEEEDRIILEKHITLGNQWAKIAEFLPGRFVPPPPCLRASL